MDGLSFGGESDSESGGINPAWNEALEFIPEENREGAYDVFRKWDSNYQNGIQKVQSEWDQYGFLKEEKVSGDDVRMALGIMNAIQNDPQQVWNTLGSSYGFQGGSESGQGESGNQPTSQTQSADNALTLPPEVKAQLDKLQQGHDTMAQIILQKQQQEEDARHDQTLRNQMEDLKKQHGYFDEYTVLMRMKDGASPEEAIKGYQEMADRIMTEANRPKPPRLLGSGSVSGVPGNKRIEPGKMSDNQVNDLISTYLAEQRAANRD